MNKARVRDAEAIADYVFSCRKKGMTEEDIAGSFSMKLSSYRKMLSDALDQIRQVKPRHARKT